MRRKSLRRKLQGAAHRAAPCATRVRMRPAHCRPVERHERHSINWVALTASAAGITILILASAAGFLLLRSEVRVDAIKPWPDATEQCYDDGFPKVDWEYWQSVNPDVIGWVTVPDTIIDYPIVQASPEDPDYYLDHNVYGEPDYRGCPYLDAECAADGFDSRVCYIYGHHLDDGSMFSSFASYADESFWDAHREVLLQTSHKKYSLNILCTDVIDAAVQSKFSAKTDDEFAQWAGDVLEGCEAVYSASRSVEPTGCPKSFADGVKVFVTCSYTRWDNERTLVYTGVSDADEVQNR